MNELHFKGELKRVPFEGKLSAALARYMPLESENDFEVFALLPSSKAPIYLNFAEHYQILERFVKQTVTSFEGEVNFLIRLSMPGGMRLPAVLLEPNVLLMQDIQPEVLRLKEGVSKGEVSRLLVIDDHLLRYQLEQGENQMHLSLYSQSLFDSSHEEACFLQLIESLAEFGIAAKEECDDAI